MAEPSLGRQIASGGLVLVLLRLSLRLIGLVSIVILFRILAPADFGIVALATLVVGFVEVFAEFGFEQSLLRNRNAQRHDYDVAWTLNFLRGLLVTAALLLAAPWAAAFLEEPRLVAVVSVLALAPLLDGLQNIGTVDFAKKLEFQKEFKLKVSQKLFSFVVTLVAAFVLRNYWALVIGVLSGRIAGVLLGYLMHPYRPRWSLQGWRAVMSFSVWVLVNNIGLFAGNQTDKVVVQRNFSAHTVGILRIAEEISGMIMELVWPIEKSLYAGYVKAADQVERFRHTLFNSIGLVSALGIPLALGLGAVAEPAVQVVLGEKGREAVPLIQVFVLHGALRSCLCGIFPVFMVLGRPEVNTQVTYAAVTMRLTVLALAFPTFGLTAVPWSMVAGTVVTFALLWWRVTGALKLSALELPAAVWRPALAGIAMALLGQQLLAQLGPGWNAWWQLAVVLPAMALTYLAVLAGLWWVCGRPDGAERSALTAWQGWWQARRLASR
jgi:lipopolysaccharide exporter